MLITKLKWNIIYLFIITNFIMAIDLTQVDKLHHQGKYEEELTELQKINSTDSHDPEVIWRIGRAIFEIADNIPDNQRDKKIKKFDEGINFLEPYLDINGGSKRARAEIVHWYTANLASKGNTIGSLKALSMVPELRQLTDKALSIDPTFSDPYFIKARIEDRLPVIFGGDKYKMGVYLSKAIKYNDKDLTVLVDAAKAYYSRNWPADKKMSMNKENNNQDLTPQNISDKEYAIQLLKKAVSLYEKNNDPSARDKLKYQEAKILLQKYQ